MKTITLVAVLAATLVGAVGVPLVLVLRAPVRWSALEPAARRGVVRASAGLGAISAVACFVAALVAGLVADHPAAPPVVGAVVAAALAWWVDQGARPVARVHGLGLDLADPRRRGAARAELLTFGAGAGSTDPVLRGTALGAATVLSNAGLDADARTIFEKIDPSGLGEHERELRALGILAGRLHAAEIAGAREALAALPAIAAGTSHHTVARVLEARLRLLEGEPARALELVAEASTDREVERGRRIVEAHALAALGDPSGAEAALDWVHREFGDDGLRRAVDPEGPASPLARARLERARGPYRG